MKAFNCTQIELLELDNNTWNHCVCKIQLSRQYGTRLKSHKVMHRKRVTCELHDGYFRSTMIKHVTPKRAEVACFIGQLWEEITWAKRRVYIAALEFDGNIRSTILNERQWNSAVHASLSRRYPVWVFSAIVLLTPKCPGLIDERFEYLSWLLLLHTSVRRENKYIFLYILRVVVCLARAKRNMCKQ